MDKVLEKHFLCGLPEQRLARQVGANAKQPRVYYIVQGVHQWATVPAAGWAVRQSKGLSSGGAGAFAAVVGAAQRVCTIQRTSQRPHYGASQTQTPSLPPHRLAPQSDVETASTVPESQQHCP